MIRVFLAILFINFITLHHLPAVHTPILDGVVKVKSRCSDWCYGIANGCGYFWDTKCGKFTMLALGVGAAYGLGVLTGYLIWEHEENDCGPTAEPITNLICSSFSNITLSDQQLIQCFDAALGHGSPEEYSMCSSYQEMNDFGACTPGFFSTLTSPSIMTRLPL